MSKISVVDYIVFLGTISVSILIGVYHGFIKKQKTTADILLGGRSMPIIPTSLSLMATYISAIVVLGYSGEVYANGGLVSEFPLTPLVYVPLGGIIFLPTLYKLKLTSAYEYLGLRFKSEAVRIIATMTFILEIMLYMGVVMYAPSLALYSISNFPIWLSIVAIGGSASFYSSIGGLKAVVWTDCFQAVMMYGGMLTVLIQAAYNVGGFSKAFEIAKAHHRVENFDFTFDPFKRHSSLNIFFGYGIIWFGAYGCDQATVQRYWSMSSLKNAFIALLLAGPLLCIVMALGVLLGFVVFANYAGCDPIALGFITKTDQITPYFVSEHLSDKPGLVGLFIACLYSGALSSVSSGLNSLAAVTWQDFFLKIAYFRQLDEGKQGVATRILCLIYGITTVGLGLVAGRLGNILRVVVVLTGTVGGPLLGVFLLGVLLPFVNSKGAISGMVASHIITMSLGYASLLFSQPHLSLPVSVDECSNETLSKVANMTAVYLRLEQAQMARMEVQPVEGFSKLYNLSYLLFTLLGMIITVLVGIIVSLMTGPSEMTKDDEKYIHPVIVKAIRKFQGQSTHCQSKEKGEVVPNSNQHHCTSTVEITCDNAAFQSH